MAKTDIVSNDFSEETKLPDKEEILMNEDELILGVLQASKFHDNTELHRKIQIKRENKKPLFEFIIRPLSEEEIQECRKKVTKYKSDPRGKHFPKMEMDVDLIKLRSHKILKATVDNGRGVIWENSQIKDKLGLLTAVDVIDAVLRAGEKDMICEIIDEISGYGAEEAIDIKAVKN